MSTLTNTITLKDGLRLDTILSIPDNQRACLVAAPCMGGSVHMYRPPLERINEAGCGCILYNPRGHGASEGEMVIDDALGDLDDIITRFVPADVPLIMVGHSAGANMLLHFGARYRRPSRFILVAPVLDSRESLFYMYRSGTIGEFLDILASYTDDSDTMRAMLATDAWLDAETWHKRGMRAILDVLPSRMRIGSFLENLFIPGYTAYDHFAEFSPITSVLLSRADTWYPLETTVRLAETRGAKFMYLEEARNHFFAGGWNAVWEHTIDACRTAVCDGAAAAQP